MTKPPDRVRREAIALLSASRVADLRNLADEISNLAKPAKAVPLPNGRAGLLVLSLALRRERQRSRRLLELLAAD